MPKHALDSCAKNNMIWMEGMGGGLRVGTMPPMAGRLGKIQTPFRLVDI